MKNKILIEDFSCQRDGLTIRGKVVRPEGGTNLTPIISCHGFMGSHKDQLPYCKIFARWGFAAYCFDFNGGGIHSQSDGKTTDMTVFTEAEDLEAVIDFVSTEDYVDISKLILMGCSQGGFVSGIVAGRLKDRVSRLIMFYPALCIPDDARRGQMIMAKFDPADIPETVPCGPMLLGRGYPTSVLNVDPYELLSPYQGPVCIVHGDADGLVNISYSVRAVEAYKAARPADGAVLPYGDVQLHTIRGGGHGFDRKHDVPAVAIVREFLHDRFCALEIDVALTGHKLTHTDSGKHLSLPFGGKAVGPYFTGDIAPGASDEQDLAPGLKYKLLHACATYTICGQDYTGSATTISIKNENNGRGWRPTVTVDAGPLTCLNTARKRAVLEDRKEGPVVRIFMPRS